MSKGVSIFSIAIEATKSSSGKDVFVSAPCLLSASNYNWKTPFEYLQKILNPLKRVSDPQPQSTFLINVKIDYCFIPITFINSSSIKFQSTETRWLSNVSFNYNKTWADIKSLVSRDTTFHQINDTFQYHLNFIFTLINIFIIRQCLTKTFKSLHTFYDIMFFQVPMCISVFRS